MCFVKGIYRRYPWRYPALEILIFIKSKGAGQFQRIGQGFRHLRIETKFVDVYAFKILPVFRILIEDRSIREQTIPSEISADLNFRELNIFRKVVIEFSVIQP